MLRTPVTADDPILLTIEDDDEEAPWMAMGDLQSWAASNLYIALRVYARRRKLFWYVASMVPILYPRPGSPYKGKFSPDVYVAFVEDRPRQSFGIEEEIGFPPFVLEVMSPDSTTRDVHGKVRAYGVLGAQEYALFAPTEDLGQPPLQGFRRDAESGRFAPWRQPEPGRLYSDVLDLWLEADGPLLRARTPDGAILPIYEELDESYERLESAHERLEMAHDRLESAYEREAEVRRALEREVARLREELERHRSE